MSNTRRMRPLLGTYVEIGVSAQQDDSESTINAAFEAIAQIHQLLSFQEASSDLSRLNRTTCGTPVTLHAISIRVLRLARAMMIKSEGLFNCTVAGALVKQGALPDPGKANFLEIGSANDIVICGTQVTLQRPVLVTLDGIAKGYAVDCAVDILKRSGHSGGWVNAGGDMRAFGDVTLPVYRREQDGSLTPVGGLSNAAIATSSVHAQPDDCFPAMIVSGAQKANLGMWSIISRSAWRADALTKVACIATDEERSCRLEKLGGRLVAI